MKKTPRTWAAYARRRHYEMNVVDRMAEALGMESYEVAFCDVRRWIECLKRAVADGEAIGVGAQFIVGGMGVPTREDRVPGRSLTAKREDAYGSVMFDTW